MKDKKPTNAQLQSKIASAIVFVPKTKDTKTIYFDDRGLRITCTIDFTIIETMFHRHVFNNLTSSGYSKPYIYTQQFLEIANENDSACMVKDRKGNIRRSFEKLVKHLEGKEDKTEFNVVTFYSWYLFNIFQPLYSLGDTQTSQFKVWFEYASAIAFNSIFLDEHKEDMTNKQFYEEWKGMMDKFFNDQEESVLIEGKSDDERAKEEVQAMNEQENEETIENMS